VLTIIPTGGGGEEAKKSKKIWSQRKRKNRKYDRD
jgi:hypothetical protein